MTDFIERRRHLRNARQGVDILIHIALHDMRLLSSPRLFGGVHAAFAAQSDILMCADLFFREAADDFLLFATEALNPGLHVLHHQSLNLRARVMEVGMEQAFED